MELSVFRKSPNLNRLEYITHRVVGIVTAITEPDRHGRLAETAFITPTETLRAVCPALQLQPDPLTWAYRDYILDETKYVEMRGIPLPAELEQVPLDRVYIQLQAVARKTVEVQRQAERDALLAQARETESVQAEPIGLLQRWVGGNRATAKADPGPISAALLHLIGEQYYRQGSLYRSDERPDPISPEETLRQHHKLVILGAPGAGKSTMLRYLARQVARQADGPLPVLVSLRDYATALTQNATLTLRDFAFAQIKDQRLIEAIKAAEDNKQLLWLVDALDEARGVYGQKAAGQVKYLPGQWVVTSRPVGYPGGLEDKDIYHFEVLPLAPADVNQFLQDWLEVVAQRRQTEADWVKQRCAWLQQQLQQQPRLQPITRNPLLLTFLVTLTTESGQQNLPATRGELYNRYLRRLCATWERQRQHYVDSCRGEHRLTIGHLEGEEAYTVARQGLHYLGWRLHLLYYGGQVEGKPTRTDLITYLATCLRRYHPAWLTADSAETLAAKIIDFWREAGLLDECLTFFAFRHLTFQEYTAACYLQKAWQTNSQKTWAWLRPRLHLSPWREPILLMSSMLCQAEREVLLRRLLHARSPYEWALRRDLHLAAELIGEGAAVEGRLVQEIARRLARLSAPRQVRPGARFGTFPRLSALLQLPIRLFGLNAGRPGHIAALGRLGPPAVEPLLRALEDKDENGDVRRAAAEALGRIGDPRAVEPLLRALGIENRDVHEAAVEALGRIGEPAVEPLLRALEDEDVCWAAAEALGGIGEPAIEPLLRALGDEDVCWAAVEVLGRIGEPAVEPLLRALGDESWHVRWAAAEALGGVGEPAVEPLLRALEDENRDVREMAAKALGGIGDPQAVEPLLRALEDENGLVRWAAAEALGRISDPRAVEPLRRALGDEDEDVRRAAAEALGRLGDPGAVEPLRRVLKRALKDRDRSLRGKVAEVLGRIGDSWAIELLLQSLGDEDRFWRQEAAEALGGIGDPRAVEPLLRALGNEDENGDVRRAAAEAVGRIGDPRAVEPLLRALEDENGLVRWAAREALGGIGDPRAVEPLLRALGDKSRDVHEAAAQALGRIGDPWAVELLLPALEDVRRVAVEALGRIGEPAVEPLLRALGDENWDVRRAAAEALGGIGEPAVEPLLRALGDENWDVRRVAAEALGHIGDPRVVKPLRRALEDEDEDVRWAAAQALGRLGDPRAVEPLRRALEDEDRFRRWAAAWALRRIGEPAAEPLLRALEDEDELLRRAAAEALEGPAGQVATLPLARRAARSLWWRLTDEEEVADAAYKALNQVTARLTELEVAALPFQDPTLASPLAHRG